MTTKEKGVRIEKKWVLENIKKDLSNMLKEYFNAGGDDEWLEEAEVRALETKRRNA